MTREEVYDRIPYQFICETMEGIRWDTIKRRRLQKEWFTPQEERALRELRGIVGNYLRGLPEASYYRGKVTTMKDYEELDRLLNEFQHRLEERNEDRTA